MPNSLPTKPNMDAIYANQLHEQRNKDLNFERQEADYSAADESNQAPNYNLKNNEEGVSFPFGALFLAAIFDLVGIIPVVNFITEPIAGFIFWMWQKEYLPKSNPLTAMIITKLIDLFLVGIFPSNISVVVYAYIIKKFNLNVEKIATEAIKGAATGGAAGAIKGAAMEAGKEALASK